MKKSFSQIPVSVLDLAVITQGGSPSLSFKNRVELVQRCEDLGYNRFWVAEHHNMDSVASSATTVLMGYLAANTASIRIGSGGIMLPNHPPLVVAEQIGTLESIYPGRIDLGLGRAPGTDPLTAYALRRDEQSAHRFPNSVREIQTYFSVENKSAKVRAIPGEGLDIPIWILGSSTDSAQLAGAFGLPYAFASHFAPRQLKEAASIYRKQFQPSHQLKKPYFMPCINVVLSDSDEESRILATSAQKLIMGIITGHRSPLQPPDPEFQINPAAQAAINQMSKYSFVGDTRTVRMKINEFVNDTEADELMVVSHIYDHDARLHSYNLLKGMQ